MHVGTECRGTSLCHEMHYMYVRLSVEKRSIDSKLISQIRTGHLKESYARDVPGHFIYLSAQWVFFSRFSVRRWSVKRSVYGPINSPHLENINRYIRQQHQNIFQMLLNLQVYEINSTWLVFLYHFASVCLHSFRIYCGMKLRKHTEKKKPHRFDIRERKIHYKTFDSDRKNGANDEISLFEITHSFQWIDIQFVRVRLWLYFHVFSVLFLSSS